MTEHTSAAGGDAAESSASGTAGRGAWGIGIATTTLADGKILDSWYPRPARGSAAELRAEAVKLGARGDGTHELDVATAEEALGIPLAALADVDELRRVRVAPVVTIIEDLADPPLDAYDVYLRLHLLSHRLVAPNGCSVEGIFGLLSNVTWTNVGPCPVDDFEEIRLGLRAAGQVVEVFGIDKFPRMTDYVVPSGVRISNADRVRLGAHLAAGTTVMHEGFVNFNAGTLGASMVEGRISQGVVVGDGSDIGGGSSIMGTLSGGGKEIVSIGERCLLGANAGIGISLGDECVVEAGLYVTAGSLVTLPDGAVVKAGELSGRSGLLYRRNSLSGAIEVLARSGSWGGLNTDLHSNT